MGLVSFIGGVVRWLLKKLNICCKNIDDRELLQDTWAETENYIVGYITVIVLIYLLYVLFVK